MNFRGCSGALTAIAIWAGAAGATPSSMIWTNASTDVQGFRTLHVGVDNYFTAFRKSADGAGDFPTDLGLTAGVLPPASPIQMEIGIDALEPSDHPLYFNAKLGVPENSLFEAAPAFSAGIFNVGTRSGVTNQNVWHAEVGRTIPGLARIVAGGYTGNRDLLRDSRGRSEASGFTVAFDRGFAPVEAGGTTWNRFAVSGDYASGRNALGGGSLGLYWYFASNASLLMGPVWFNERGLNGEWKWTAQLDVNVPY